MARTVYGTLLDVNTNPIVGAALVFSLVNRAGQNISEGLIAQTGGVVEAVSTTTDANGEFSIDVVENVLILNETYYRVDVKPTLAGNVLYTSFMTYIGAGPAVTLRELAGVLPAGTSSIFEGSTVIVNPLGVAPFGDPESTLARVYGTLLDASATPIPNVRIDFTLVNSDFQPVTGYLQGEVYSLIETYSVYSDSLGRIEAFIQGNTAIDSETYYKVHIHNSDDEKFVASLEVGDDLTLREFKAQGQAVTGEAKTLEGYIDLARRWAEEYPDPVLVDDLGISHFSSMYWAVQSANNGNSGVQIDDTVVAADKVWSSLKVFTTIEAAKYIVGSKSVNEGNIQDGYILSYSSLVDELIYVPNSGGTPPAPSDNRLDQQLEYTDVVSATYTLVGKKSVVTYATGHRAVHAYNTYNNLARVDYYDGAGTLINAQTMTYDVATPNQVLVTSVWAGPTTSAIVAPLRLDLELEYTDVTDVVYTVAGKRSTVTYVTGNKVVYTYNSFNNPSLVTYYDVDGTTEVHTQNIGYDQNTANQKIHTTTWI